MAMNDGIRDDRVKQTELQRLQNERVGGPAKKAKAGGKAKKPRSEAETRMLEGARNACGPYNGRDWRWYGA